MNTFRLLPVILSLLLIAAHFYRAGLTVIAIGCLLTSALLFVTRPWSARILQSVLVVSSLEWLRTMFQLVNIRQEMGMDWIRLAVILGSVALFTCASAAVFFLRKVRSRYNL